MARNPILEEIYAAREKLIAEYGGDIHAYIQSARERALASGRPIATPRQEAKDRNETMDEPEQTDSPRSLG